MCHGVSSSFFLSFSLDGTTTGNSSTRRQVEWHVRMQPPNSSIPDEFWRVEREKEIGLPVENWLDNNNNNNNRRRRRGRITHLSLSLVKNKRRSTAFSRLRFQFHCGRVQTGNHHEKPHSAEALADNWGSVLSHLWEPDSYTQHSKRLKQLFSFFQSGKFSRVYPIRFLWFFYKRENAQHFVRQESLATAKRKKLQTFLFFFPILTTRFE